MRAIVLREPTGPTGLHLADVPQPEPTAEEVRVKVHAIGVNRADLIQTYGKYPAPPGVPADIPGLEYAGTVDALGSAVTGLQVGDTVWGIVGGGAYAEYLCVHARALAKMPSGLGFEQAAALPEAALTAFDALFTQAALKQGETVLIHAAGSGVGTLAIQLSHHAGAMVCGTSRTPQKLERAKELGLHHAFGSETFVTDVLRVTGSRGADVVLDLVGGQTTARSLECLAMGGRMVVLGLVGGADATLSLGLLLRKRATLRGSVMRARNLEEKVALHQTLGTTIATYVTQQLVHPIVERTMPLAEAGAALRLLAENGTYGKIVLVP